MLTKETTLRVGIMLQCLSFIAIALYPAAKTSQKHQMAHVERSLNNLSKRFEAIEHRAVEFNNETSEKDSTFAIELDSIQRELDDARSLLGHSKILSNTAFASWALLTITGSTCTVIGVMRRKPQKLTELINAE